MRLSLSSTIAIITTLGLAMVGPPAVGAVDDDPGRTGVPSPTSTSRTTTMVDADAHARELAAAMDVPTVVAASTMGSDPAGFAVMRGSDLPVTTGAPGDILGGIFNSFPTAGDTFVVLSTGQAAAASPSNNVGFSTTLDGLNSDAGRDLVQLHLTLRPPPGALCLAFDVQFHSSEYPQWVGSSFNDVFTAQIGDGSLSTVNGEVEAPGNFARDVLGNPLSVNSAFTMSSRDASTYGGSTSALRASALLPLSTSADDVELYLSIQDVGDNIVDSAVYIDGFDWTSDPWCQFSMEADTDGDGLLDTWEKEGYSPQSGLSNDFVDLPAMGADPLVPDIFVEIDYMVERDGKGQIVHSEKPEQSAIDLVIDSFASQGIHLHVDYGTDSPLRWGTQETWGALSRSNQLAHSTSLGSTSFRGYNWTAFDNVKEKNFREERQAFFHYNVWAHDLSGDMKGSSGISRGISASDFIVSIGSWDLDTTLQQSGTFMHELGHNLNLRHGGADDINHKPNFLSVMNYTQQLIGLNVDGKLEVMDYSDEQLSDLDEKNLHEADGINASGDRFALAEWCPSGALWVAGAIDWNCDGDTQDIVSKDINNDGEKSKLVGHDDWSALKYKGGLVGSLGSLRELPLETSLAEPTLAEYKELLAQLGEEVTAEPVVYVAGSAWLTNTTSITGTHADVVVSGDAECNSDVTVDGDLVVGGSLLMTDRCTVHGDVRAGGNVTMESSAHIGGSLTTPADVRFQSSAHIAGAISAGGSVISTEGRTPADLSASGAVGGLITSGAIVEVPVIEVPTDPTVDSGHWSGYRNVTWQSWMNATALSHAAPTWSAGLTASPGCTMAPWSDSVNGTTADILEDTLIDARSAASGCQSVSLQQMTIRLSGDLVLVADNFTAHSGLTFESADGAPHQVSILVPGEFGTCSAGQIAITGGATTAIQVQLHLRAPGQVQLNGDVDFAGTVAGGCVAATGTVVLRTAATG